MDTTIMKKKKMIFLNLGYGNNDCQYLDYEEDKINVDSQIGYVNKQCKSTFKLRTRKKI